MRMRPRQWSTNRRLWAICTVVVCVFAGPLPAAVYGGDDIALWRHVVGLILMAFEGVGPRPWERVTYLVTAIGILFACVIVGWALHGLVLVLAGIVGAHPRRPTQ